LPDMTGRTQWLGRFCVAAMAAMLPLMAASQAQAENENFSNKPAPALFNADCTGAGCHKGPAGLGKGQSQSGLAGFLREHYTNSRESAAALAAYILKLPPGAAPAPEPKPTRASTQRPGGEPPQRGGASWFDPEPSGPPEARPGEPRNSRQQQLEKEREKARPPTRSAARPPEAKPAEPKPGEAKPEAKPAEGEEPSATATPSDTPAEPAAAPADRRRRVAEPEPKPAEAKPAPVPRNQRGRQPTVAATPAAPAEPAPPPAPAAPPPPQFDIFD